MSELEVGDVQIKEMLERLGATYDGRLLYLHLQKVMTSFPVGPSPDALREHHGRRMFAAELMADMAKGIRESHGGRDPTERPITFVRAEPARVSGYVSARERIRASDPELAGTGDGTK